MNIAHIAVKSKTPGPGHYGEALRISANGEYPVSTIPTSKVPTFKLPIKKIQRVTYTDYTKDNPAPNTYTPTKESIMASNKHCLRNFILYKGNRKIDLHDKTKRDIPGPGTYVLPSGFGFHASEEMTTPLSARSRTPRMARYLMRNRSTNLM